MQRTVLFISVLVIIATLPMTAVLATMTLTALATIVVLNGMPTPIDSLTKKWRSLTFKFRA